MTRTPSPGSFAQVAESFRVYWEADTDADFTRANWAARRALYRYALRLLHAHARHGIQRSERREINRQPLAPLNAGGG